MSISHHLMAQQKLSWYALRHFSENCFLKKIQLSKGQFEKKRLKNLFFYGLSISELLTLLKLDHPMLWELKNVSEDKRFGLPFLPCLSLNIFYPYILCVVAFSCLRNFICCHLVEDNERPRKELNFCKTYY